MRVPRPTDSQRRAWLAQAVAGAGLLLGGSLSGRSARAAESALPVPASLPEAARLAAERQEPLVLLISLPGCPYCELVRRNYLIPARTQGLPAWQLNVNDQQTPLTGFDGQLTTARAQTQQWKTRFTPTLLFFNAKGQEIAERLVGASPDFFGAYLEQRLSTARQALAGKAAGR